MKRISIILFYFLCLTELVHAKEELIIIENRRGVIQRFLLLEPNNSVFSVILFAGGHGNLDLSSDAGKPIINWGKNNFLVRVRHEFVQNGFTVALIDAPSDRKTKEGMMGGFRNSEEHVKDIDYIISFLRKRKDIPIWLIGTSRGTESAAYAAIHSKQSPAGVVLTSSMTEENRKGIPVKDMALEKITIPVLIVAHQGDKCGVTLPLGSEDIRDKLVNSNKVEVKYFKGGYEPKSRLCGALSPHGYYGIEKEVVAYISFFIKHN
jgi:pimeloyl-ACP methyl ester carboxylesterase